MQSCFCCYTEHLVVLMLEHCFEASEGCGLLFLPHICLHLPLPTGSNFPMVHVDPPSSIFTHYQSPRASIPLSVSGLSGEQTGGREKGDVSLGQFVLTHGDAQVGERCQTTQGGDEGRRGAQGDGADRVLWGWAERG